MLTDFEEDFFTSFENLDFNKWYRLDPQHPDSEKRVAAVKKRIDIHDDAELSGDLLFMKRIVPFCDMFDKEKEKERTMKDVIKFHDDLIKANGKKEWPVQ